MIKQNFTVFDNFLRADILYEFENLFYKKDDMGFYLQKANKMKKNNLCFTHNIVNYPSVNSELFERMTPFLKEMDIHSTKNILKLEFRLLPRSNEFLETDFKNDFNEKHYTLIYNISDDNGYLKLNDGTIIKNKKNRAIIFENNLQYSQSNCTDEIGTYCLVLNYKDSK